MVVSAIQGGCSCAILQLQQEIVQLENLLEYVPAARQMRGRLLIVAMRLHTV